jgi:hypothetical protein
MFYIVSVLAELLCNYQSSSYLAAWHLWCRTKPKTRSACVLVRIVRWIQVEVLCIKLTWLNVMHFS